MHRRIDSDPPVGTVVRLRDHTDGTLGRQPVRTLGTRRVRTVPTPSVIRRLGLWLLRLGITAGVLAYVGSGIDLGGFVRVVAGMDGGTWAILLITTTAADRALAVGRWLVLIRGAGVDLPVLPGVRLLLVSSFLGPDYSGGFGFW